MAKPKKPNKPTAAERQARKQTKAGPKSDGYSGKRDNRRPLGPNTMPAFAMGPDLPISREMS